MYKQGTCNAHEMKAYLIINHYKVSYIKDMGWKYEDELCTRVRNEFTISEVFKMAYRLEQNLSWMTKNEWKTQDDRGKWDKRRKSILSIED